MGKNFPTTPAFHDTKETTVTNSDLVCITQHNSTYSTFTIIVLDENSPRFASASCSNCEGVTSCNWPSHTACQIPWAEMEYSWPETSGSGGNCTTVSKDVLAGSCKRSSGEAGSLRDIWIVLIGILSPFSASATANTPRILARGSNGVPHFKRVMVVFIGLCRVTPTDTAEGCGDGGRVINWGARIT